jgi:rhodanese-related sulfurtransferase/mannose-6-phosphate isomerase-like protein (cupin superfamily)
MQRTTKEASVLEIVKPSLARQITSTTSSKTPEELGALVQEYAATDGWLHRVRLRAEGRWYERLYLDADHDIWVISWLPGQSTGFHDHGESAGAFVVTTGALEEHRPGHPSVPIYPHQPRAFGPDYAHDVRNVARAPALSIHAYSPPLAEMNEYELDGVALVARDRRTSDPATLDQEWQEDTHKPRQGTGTLNIEEMLSDARTRLQRLSPEDANEASHTSDAILVDIRPEAQRAIKGAIEGALVVERNVLEWRFDPTSSARLPIATDHQLRLIVFCSEGYTSSLAAAALQDLGLWRATDMIGGFQAWQASGLPTLPPTNP